MNKEIIKTVFENEKIIVEEIVSNGEASSNNFWYDNPIDEWVSVVTGKAVLQFEDKDVYLDSGENFYIKAHAKHRVKYTSQDCKWLCVFIKACKN